ncbi:MAG: CBS domain-containing protein, partial [Thermoplasmata archaeon]
MIKGKLIRELMDTNPIYISLPNDRDNVIEVMKKQNLFYLPVIDEHSNKLEGTVSVWDFVAKINEFQLSGLMNRHPPYLFYDSTIKEASNIMLRD